jgi:DNA repair photolyase
MLKKSKGNMYDWVTHTHAHLGGECLHKCSYCYVAHPKFGRAEKFSGPISLLEEEFSVQYGSGKTIFIDNMNDLFAKDVPNEWIRRVLEHCRSFNDNHYVFQTKNPERYFKMIGL